MLILRVGCSLISVLDDKRDDVRRFMVLQPFDREVFLQCFRQSHQVMFGDLEVTTVVEYVIHRLKGTLHYELTEDKPLLRKCICQGFVGLCDLRGILTDLIELLAPVNCEIKNSSSNVSDET